jgi:hypothetical protein
MVYFCNWNRNFTHYNLKVILRLLVYTSSFEVGNSQVSMKFISSGIFPKLDELYLLCQTSALRTQNDHRYLRCSRDYKIEIVIRAVGCAIRTSINCTQVRSCKTIRNCLFSRYCTFIVRSMKILFFSNKFSNSFQATENSKIHLTF